MKKLIIWIVLTIAIAIMIFLVISINYNSNKNDILLNTIVAITIILATPVFIAYIIKRITIERGQYIRETSDIIEPILAESIVDGKIDAKDLIMTCIINLMYKKKIVNLDNDSIKLVDVSDLSDIEKETLKIVFATSLPIEKYEGNIARLSDLNIIFKEESKRTLDIYDKLNKIKKIIKNKLFERELINPIWNFVLKRIRELSGLLALNSLIILLNKPSSIFLNYLPVFFYIVSIINIIVYLCISKKELILNILRNENLSRRRKSSSSSILVVYCIIMLGFGILNFRFMDIKIVLCLCLVIITNLILFKLSNTYVLTKKGKEEYKKAYMLKKYLMDYSLIEQRDMDGLVIFDEYLIYATAFGIPSKITSKYRESFLNLNISLQVIMNF